MEERQPLLKERASLSTSLPISSGPYFTKQLDNTTADGPTNYGSNAAYHGSLPQSPLTRRPLDRIHHLPPPSITTYQNQPTNQTVNHSTTYVLASSPMINQTPPAVSRLSSLLSMSMPSQSLTSPLQHVQQSVTVPIESKRVEVVADRTGRPQVREEPEWPNPKKDAQYDEDTLLDYHSLLIVFLLLTLSLILYFAAPDLEVGGNPAYIWSLFVVTLFVVYHIAQLIEAIILSALSFASGSRVWKVYFYSQALHETLGNVLTILFVMYARYYCPWILFPANVKYYMDPILNFALLLFLAVLVRQLLTKHLTYLLNQERYSKAVQDLLFKGQVLNRLCDPFAYQPISERPSGRAEFAPPLNRQATILTQTEQRKPHPLYDVFARLRDHNDDSLPGSGFFATEKLCKAKCKELFNNLDRERKGFVDLHDFRAFFPKDTALRAFKLFFPPKAFKPGKETVTVEKVAASDLPPMPFVPTNMIKQLTVGDGSSAVTKTGKKKKASAAKTEQAVTEKNQVIAKMNKVEANKAETNKADSNKAEEKTNKAAEKAVQTKEAQPLVDDTAQVRKGSGTILESINQPIVSPSVDALTRRNSIIITDSGVAIPSNNQPVGEALLEGQSEAERHLNSMRLDYAALETRVLGFYESRQTLSNSLRDLDGLADVVQSVVCLVFWLVVGVLLIIAFDEHLQSVMFSVSTLLLSFTFVFAATIKEMFQSIILIFFIKPYNVGDRVNIAKDKYRVHSIQLMTTTFRDLQNKIAIVPNSKLASASIQNLTRSSNVVIKMKISVAFDTPSSKLAALREKIVNHVRERPLQWKSTVSMHLADLQPQTNTVNVTLLLSHLAQYTQVKQWKRSKTELLHTIREIMIELGVAWKNPESTVSIVNGECLREVIAGVSQMIDSEINNKKAANTSAGKVELVQDVQEDQKKLTQNHNQIELVQPSTQKENLL